MPLVSYSFLPIFPQYNRNNVNQLRKEQEAGLTDLENQMEQDEFAFCRLIDIKVAIDSLLLKETSKTNV